LCPKKRQDWRPELGAIMQSAQLASSVALAVDTSIHDEDDLMQMKVIVLVLVARRQV